jgi:hypothetical protein
MSYRREDEQPPPPRSLGPGLVTRLDGVTEIDPEIMGIAQQDIPVWDTLRMRDNRAEYLRSMRTHFADEILGSDDL